MSIRSLLRRAESIDTAKAVVNAVAQTTPRIVELNRVQLFTGYIKSGEKLGEYNLGAYGYRNQFYAFEKYRRNPLPGLGNPDLKDTGSFYAGMYARLRGNILEFGSTDEKALKLQLKYPMILGLGPIAKSQYVPFLRKIFLNEIRRQLQL